MGITAKLWGAQDWKTLGKTSGLWYGDNQSLPLGNACKMPGAVEATKVHFLIQSSHSLRRQVLLFSVFCKQKKGDLGTHLPNLIEPVRGRSESLTSIQVTLNPPLTLRPGRGHGKKRWKDFFGGGGISFP